MSETKEDYKGLATSIAEEWEFYQGVVSHKAPEFRPLYDSRKRRRGKGGGEAGVAEEVEVEEERDERKREREKY